MEFVCPQPMIWQEIYQRLTIFYLKNKNKIKKGPPKCLILNGWVYSTDYAKKLRWKETVEWAQENGCSELIPELKKAEKYEVNKIEPILIQEEDPYGFNDK